MAVQTNAARLRRFVWDADDFTVVPPDTAAAGERLNTPADSFSADASGHEHKGKGEGGGQFVKGGGHDGEAEAGEPEAAKRDDSEPAAPTPEAPTPAAPEASAAPLPADTPAPPQTGSLADSEAEINDAIAKDKAGTHRNGAGSAVAANKVLDDVQAKHSPEEIVALASKVVGRPVRGLTNALDALWADMTAVGRGMDSQEGPDVEPVPQPTHRLTARPKAKPKAKATAVVPPRAPAAPALPPPSTPAVQSGVDAVRDAIAKDKAAVHGNSDAAAAHANKILDALQANHTPAELIEIARHAGTPGVKTTRQALDAMRADMTAVHRAMDTQNA